METESKVREFIEPLKALVPTISLALFGGIAGYILKTKEHRNFKEFCGDIIISLFAGLLMHFILDNYNISNSWKAVCISLASCMSREVLVIIQKKFLYTVEKTAGGITEKKERKRKDK